VYYGERGARLGSFWDDLYKGAGAVAEIAATVQKGAIAGREVQAGNAQVTVVPTRQGIVNYSGQAGQYVQDHGRTIVPIVLGAGAVLALVLSQRSGGSRRRRR
jgi:hypothetical protein